MNKRQNIEAYQRDRKRPVPEEVRGWAFFAPNMIILPGVDVKPNPITTCYSRHFKQDRACPCDECRSLGEAKSLVNSFVI